MATIFISWSGAQSREVAQVLRTDVRLAFPHAEFWMSARDLAPGAPWAGEILAQLSRATLGIVCLTAENLRSPWINFEAGAVAHALGTKAVIPYLFEVSEVELTGPLAQFQAVQADEPGTRAVFEAVNRALGDAGLTEMELVESFAVWWPRIREKLAALRGKPKVSARRREDRELLEELVSLVRQLRRETAPGFAPAAVAPNWSPEDFSNRTPDEIDRFFENELWPEARDHAGRDWDYVEASDTVEKILSRAREIAGARAVSLGLGEHWSRWSVRQRG